MVKFRVYVLFVMALVMLLPASGCGGGSTILDDPSREITAKGGNKPPKGDSPVAVMTADPPNGFIYPGDPGLLVAFDGTGSYSSGGEIVKWEWKFGDSNGKWLNITNGIANHLYTTGGKFRAQLRVTDDRGNRDTTTLVIHVFDGPIYPE